VKVETFDRLEAIGAESWDALHRSARLTAPFSGYTWQREWVRAFGAGRRLELRTVSDAGGLVAVLPLYEEAPGVLRLIGGTDVSDYLDLVAVAGREEDAWTALLAALGDDGVLDQHCVPAASPTVTVLPSLASVAGLVATVEVEEHCPVLTLPATWEDYLGRLSGKHRHELSRKMRRLAREVPDARLSAVDTAGDIAARLGDFLTLHRLSRTGKAKFMDERMEGFFRASVVALAAEGRARLWLLDTSEGPIASFVTLEWPGTVGLYNSGFRPDKASLSPGLVLLARLIEDAIARRVPCFDFLRGEERYKFEFGPTSEPVHTVRVFAERRGFPR
jgi:CelD/BcsL family acetyltransferase involved in cellulose biosynthesis